MNSFAVIDFETATHSRASVCQVSLVSVIDNKIVDVYDTLVKPPDNKYNPFHIGIHKIKPEMTINSPTFYGIFDELNYRINNIRDYNNRKNNDTEFKIVAHNAAFDRSVFKASLEHYQLNDLMNTELVMPNLWFCTHQEFKKLGYEKTKLNILCDKFGIPLKHHDAKSDTLATTQLMFELKKILHI